MGRCVSTTVSCISPKGVVPMRKRCPTLAGQPPWCDRISTLAKNQLYPFSDHTCAHRHSRDSGKLLVIGGFESPGVVMSIIPLDVQRRYERRWAARFVRQAPEPVSEKCGRLGQRLGEAAKAKRKTRLARPARSKSARTV